MSSKTNAPSDAEMRFTAAKPIYIFLVSPKFEIPAISRLPNDPNMAFSKVKKSSTDFYGDNQLETSRKSLLAKT